MTQNEGFNFEYRPYGTYSTPRLKLQHPGGEEIIFEGHAAYAAHTLIMTSPIENRQTVMAIIWGQNYVDPRAEMAGPTPHFSGAELNQPGL